MSQSCILKIGSILHWNSYSYSSVHFIEMVSHFMNWTLFIRGSYNVPSSTFIRLEKRMQSYSSHNDIKKNKFFKKKDLIFKIFD